MAATVATYPGRGIIWGSIKNASAPPRNIQWGLGGGFSNSANANVNLFSPTTESRVAGTVSITNTTQLGDTFLCIGTVVCSNAGKTISEAGLFNTVTASPTSTLAASLTASATTMTLGTNIGTGSATSGAYYAQVGNEVVLVTGANSATLTIARGQIGSTSAVQTSGTPVTFGGDGSGGGGSGWTTGQTVSGANVLASYGGDLFIHSDFSGIALNVNDSIAFTFSDTLTGFIVIGLTSAFTVLSLLGQLLA